mmetsp:Transcript_70044/g.226634  ORF Transcript_70044/g.226634 Transcript_70044/m.226634 type:complete len:209 (+) Transcript_70044:123-749(+)
MPPWALPCAPRPLLHWQLRRSHGWRWPQARCLQTQQSWRPHRELLVWRTCCLGTAGPATCWRVPGSHGARRASQVPRAAAPVRARGVAPRRNPKTGAWRSRTFTAGRCTEAARMWRWGIRRTPRRRSLRRRRRPPRAAGTGRSRPPPTPAWRRRPCSPRATGTCRWAPSRRRCWPSAWRPSAPRTWGTSPARSSACSLPRALFSLPEP